MRAASVGKRHRTLLLVIGLGLGVLGTACSESEAPGRGAVDTSRPGREERQGRADASDSESAGVGEAYVRLIVGQDDGTELASVAVTGSPAYLYALHQLAGLALVPGSDVTVEPDGVDVRVCQRPSGEGSDASTECFRLGGFQTGDDGRIRTFSVNGQPIDGRVTAGLSQGVTADGVTVAVKTAVVSTRGDLNVVFDITNNSPQSLTFLPGQLRYQPVGGRPAAMPEDMIGDPAEIPASGELSAIAFFEHSRFGGTLIFAGRTHDGAEVQIDVGVPDPT